MLAKRTGRKDISERDARKVRLISARFHHGAHRLVLRIRGHSDIGVAVRRPFQFSLFRRLLQRTAFHFRLLPAVPEAVVEQQQGRQEQRVDNIVD